MTKPLAETFAGLPDPRVDRGKKDSLADILIISLCAVVAGADSWEQVEAFGRAKFDWLKQFLALPNGTTKRSPTCSPGSIPERSPDT